MRSVSPTKKPLPYLFISIFTAAILGYLIRIFYARNLDVASFGLFYAAIALMEMLVVLSGLGANSSMTYYGAKFLGEGKSLKFARTVAYTILVRFCIPILIILLIFFFRGIAVDYFGDPKIIHLLPYLALYYMAYNLLITFARVLLTKENYLLGKLWEPLTHFFVLLISWILYSAGTWNIANLVIVWGSVYTLFAILYIYVILLSRFRVNLNGALTIDYALIKKMFAYGIPFFVGAGAQILMLKVDTQIVATIIGLQEVGYYEVGVSLATTLMTFVVPLTTFLSPRIATLQGAKNYSGVAELLNLSLKYSAIALAFISGGFVLFSEHIISLLFGVKYLPASELLTILSISLYFGALGNIFITAIAALGHAKTRTKILLITATINIIGSIPAALYFGLLPLVYVTLISNIIFVVLGWISCNKKISIETKSLPKTFSVLSLFALAIFFIKVINLETIFKIITFGITNLSLFLYCLSYGVISKDDFKKLVSMEGEN